MLVTRHMHTWIHYMYRGGITYLIKESLVPCSESGPGASQPPSKNVEPGTWMWHQHSHGHTWWADGGGGGAQLYMYS